MDKTRLQSPEPLVGTFREATRSIHKHPVVERPDTWASVRFCCSSLRTADVGMSRWILTARGETVNASGADSSAQPERRQGNGSAFRNGLQCVDIYAVA
jgi:hypothetical protein